MNNAVIIGIGVAAAAGIAIYIVSKNKSVAQLLPSQPQNNLQPTTTTSTQETYTPGAKQTMWKDRDGNIFQLTSDMQKWGYVIKVNGSVHGKWNQMMTMFVGPDGYVIGADNNGSVFQWKNNQWNYVIKDNKTEADALLQKNGQPKLFSGVSGLGCYILT